MNAARGAQNYSYALGAAGGTIGTGAGAATAFIFFVMLTLSKGREVLGEETAPVHTADGSGRAKTESYGRLMYVLTITVLPIIVSSAVYNCSNVVDNFLFGQGMDRLGYTGEEIAVFWGALGQYQLLFNIPVAVSNALSSSLIPSLTRAVSSGNQEETNQRIAAAVRFSMLIAIPAAVGIGVLAEPVSNLLFAGEDNSLLIRLTMAGALAVVFFSLSTVTNAVLQGLNRLDVPVRHAFLSLAVHIILVEVFLMIFHMGIFSVVFANILFAFMMCLLNGRSIARYAGYRQEYKKTVILPFVCSLLMGAAAWSIYKGLVFLCPALLSGGRLGMAVLVFPPVAVSMAVYGVLLVKLKAIDEKELKEMPMGTRLVRLCKRVRLM